MISSFFFNSIFPFKIAGSIIVCPAELVKIKLQVKEFTGRSEYQETVDMVKSIHSRHGVKGFLQGMNITLIRETPCMGNNIKDIFVNISKANFSITQPYILVYMIFSNNYLQKIKNLV